MKRSIATLLIILVGSLAQTLLVNAVRDEPKPIAKPAVVKMSDGLRRDLDAIFTQINLLSQQAQNKVLKEQIRLDLGSDYEFNYQDYAWHLKQQPTPKEAPKPKEPEKPKEGVKP